MSINKLTLKRITNDYKRFQEEKPESFMVHPNPDNILEIYFLMFGSKDTVYEGGHYIGKIVHNIEYPIKAPDYYMLTPNGRFDVNKKICLTNSSYHQNDWAPSAWNLITILEGFKSVFHSDIKEDKVGISHLNTSDDQIKKLCQQSIEYNNKNLSEFYSKFNVKVI